MIKIRDIKANYEREPLAVPFGFKGGYLTETWQTVVSIDSTSGKSGMGLGLQSVLWSDPNVFMSFDENGGNEIMFDMMKYALKCAEDMSFENPIGLLDELLPITYEYGKKISRNPDLRLTFALNSLVAVDNAAWMLYSKEKGISKFDDMIPGISKPALSFRHSAVSCVPAVGYAMSAEEIIKLFDEGYFVLKVKIGSDPDKDGNAEKMLKWDMERLSLIHRLSKDRKSEYTKSGNILYYIDANGRYNSKDDVLRFLEHADRIGALDRIILFEEPFSEENEFDVHDIPVRLAADESAHSDKEVIELIQKGYGAIALKPIAKTMSMTFKIAQIAYEKSIPCFCADLTVNPIMVDWNKNVAARLAPLPEIHAGLLESNGPQNYKNWEKMKSYHPSYGAAWIDSGDGIYRLDDEFYTKGGGIFGPSSHYLSLL